jgi:transcriptional regulator with XRE-family HTH domain
MAEMRALLARNLRLWRNARGLSQEELADRAGINRGYMSDLERGRYSATIVMIGKLAEALAIEPAELLRQSAKSGASRTARPRVATMLEAAEEAAGFAAPKPARKKRSRRKS